MCFEGTWKIRMTPHKPSGTSGTRCWGASCRCLVHDFKVMERIVCTCCMAGDVILIVISMPDPGRGAIHAADAMAVSPNTTPHLPSGRGKYVHLSLV